MNEIHKDASSREMSKFKQCPNPDCGQVNNPEENFCVECGEPLPPDMDDKRPPIESDIDDAI